MHDVGVGLQEAGGVLSYRFAPAKHEAPARQKFWSLSSASPSWSNRIAQTGMLRMLQAASPRLLTPMAHARHVAAGAAAAAAPGSRPIARGIVFGEERGWLTGWLALLWWCCLALRWRRRRECAAGAAAVPWLTDTWTACLRPSSSLADMDGTLTKAVIDFADMRRRVAAVGGLDSLNGAGWGPGGRGGCGCDAGPEGQHCVWLAICRALETMLSALHRVATPPPPLQAPLSSLSQATSWPSSPPGRQSARWRRTPPLPPWRRARWRTCS